MRRRRARTKKGHLGVCLMKPGKQPGPSHARVAEEEGASAGGAAGRACV